MRLTPKPERTDGLRGRIRHELPPRFWSTLTYLYEFRYANSHSGRQFCQNQNSKTGTTPLFQVHSDTVMIPSSLHFRSSTLLRLHEFRNANSRYGRQFRQNQNIHPASDRKRIRGRVENGLFPRSLHGALQPDTHAGCTSVVPPGRVCTSSITGIPVTEDGSVSRPIRGAVGTMRSALKL